MWDLIRIEDPYGNTQFTINMNGRTKAIDLYMLDHKFKLQSIGFKPTAGIWKVRRSTST